MTRATPVHSGLLLDHFAQCANPGGAVFEYLCHVALQHGHFFGLVSGHGINSDRSGRPASSKASRRANRLSSPASHASYSAVTVAPAPWLRESRVAARSRRSLYAFIRKQRCQCVARGNLAATSSDLVR